MPDHLEVAAVDSKQMSQGEYLQFGGMAVVEGVMMRSPHYWSVACRAPSGQIVVKTEPLTQTWIGRQKWLKKPFLRGSLAMLDTMALGSRAMNFASNVQLEAESKGQAKTKTLDNVTLALTLLASLGFGFLVFKLGPEAIAQWLRPGAKDQQGTGTNYLAELIKIVFFIGYLMLIRRLPAILEVFKYHGAEHKAINVVEAKEDLTVAAAKLQTRLHPRCGTNFAIIVLLVGLLLFPLIPRFGQADAPMALVVLIRLGIELCVLPIIAGISYEIIRAAGKAKDQRWVNVLLKPGLMTQYITTEEPEEKHLEVAVASLKAVLLAEETGELTNVALDPAFGESGDAAAATA